MTLYAFLAIGIGAAFGAWLRWGFGLWFNPVLPELPLGTLAANLVGGYLIGWRSHSSCSIHHCRRSGGCLSSPAFSAG